MFSRPIVFGLLAALSIVQLSQGSPSELLQHLDIFPLKNEALMFEEFIHKHSKAYKHDFEEKLKRFKVFSTNLRKIAELNQHEQGTAVYGITEFTDLTYQEFRSTKMGLNKALYSEPPRTLLQETEHFEGNTNLPTQFDWRQTKGVISEVKNQGMCGSCWAFSTTGNIEGVWAVKKNETVSLSEQELVDCDSLDAGCGGGLPTNAFKTIIRLGGIESERDYSYDGVQEKCRFNRTLSHVSIDSYLELPKNETYFQNYLFANGPISIGLNANAMQFYFGGISHPPKFLCDPQNLDHGVLIVGFGVGKTRILHRTLPYWIIKNSWGKGWGEHGYYRIYRGDDSCGLTQMASSAVIN